MNLTYGKSQDRILLSKDQSMCVSVHISITGKIRDHIGTYILYYTLVHIHICTLKTCDLEKHLNA